MSDWIVVDKDFCEKSSMMRDGFCASARVVPYLVGSYVYQAINMLGISASDVVEAVMTKWDSLGWNRGSIGINLWNKVFSTNTLTISEWNLIKVPVELVCTIRTSLTSPDSVRDCRPIRLPGMPDDPANLLVFTKAGYAKLASGASPKFGVYRYGAATGDHSITTFCNEVTKVVTPPYPLQGRLAL